MSDPIKSPSKVCIVCKTQFENRRTSQHFCSRSCWLSTTNRPKSRICKFCKKVFIHRAPDRVHCSMRCYSMTKKTFSGKLNNNWKGKEVGYAGMHKWLFRHLGSPQKCKFCGITIKERRIEWANISHTYLRDFSDWMPLCTFCHRKYDKKFKGDIARNFTKRSSR